MPCDAATLLSDGLANFGGLSRVQLLQVTAQSAANWLVSLDGTAEVGVDAILERACLSGVYCLDKKALLQSIAQNACSMLNPACASPPPTNLEIFPSSPSSDFIWERAGDPGQDFLLEWGTVSGGPYENSEAVDPTIRAYAPFISSGTYYGIVTARDSDDCVSDPSNEVQFTVT